MIQKDGQKYIVRRPPMTETIKDINDRVKRMVSNAITWASDDDTVDKIEHWQSHANRILSDEDYHTHDDCDGFALTSAELCKHYGIDPSLIRIVFCEIPNTGYHLVCSVDDPDENTTWVHCNNERRVVKWDDLDYVWIKYMSYDNLGNWFEI